MEETRCYCSEASFKELRSRIATVPTHAVHHIDTGDFHYLSALFLERIDEPFELVFIDNHSDTQPLAFEEPGMVSCGSWRALAESSNSNLRSVRAFGIGGSKEETRCGDRESDVLPVYLSIDLDALSHEEFTANWDQGGMLYEDIERIILECTAGRRVLGADICGGITMRQAMSCEELPSECPLSRNRTLRERLSAFLAGIVA